MMGWKELLSSADGGTQGAEDPSRVTQKLPCLQQLLSLHKLLSVAVAWEQETRDAATNQS